MALDMSQRFYDFYRKNKGQFLSKSEGHKYFFQIFTVVQSQNETLKNGKKSTFQMLKAHITKRLTLWPNV